MNKILQFMLLLFTVGLTACQPIQIDISQLQNPARADTSADASSETMPAEEEVPAEPVTADNYFELYHSNQPLPMLVQNDPDFSYEDALAFQDTIKAKLEAAGDAQIGYKLGLTAPQTKNFGATEPLYGPLYSSMQLEPGSTIDKTEFVIAMMELELAYIFNDAVTYPVTKEALQAAVGGVAPAVELPDMMYVDLEKLSWLDLTASNVGARHFVMGTPAAVDAIDVNAVEIVATNNGATVSEGVGSHVMGDQWEALLFLVEKLNERGQQIEAGDIVLSGATNMMFQALPGHFVVDYGTLGTIEFDVVD